MIKVIKHYSPYFNKNYLVVYLFGRKVIDLTFTPNIFVAPYDDLVHKYLKRKGDRTDAV